METASAFGSIGEMGLSVESIELLGKAGIRTRMDLQGLTEADLAAVPGMTKTYVSEIRSALESQGVGLRENDDYYAKEREPLPLLEAEERCTTEAPKTEQVGLGETREPSVVAPPPERDPAKHSRMQCGLLTDLVSVAERTKELLEKSRLSDYDELQRRIAQEKPSHSQGPR